MRWRVGASVRYTVGSEAKRRLRPTRKYDNFFPLDSHCLSFESLAIQFGIEKATSK